MKRYMLSFDYRDYVNNDAVDVFKWVPVSPTQVPAGVPSFSIVPDHFEEGSITRMVIPDRGLTPVKVLSGGKVRTLSKNELENEVVKLREERNSDQNLRFK